MRSIEVDKAIMMDTTIVADENNLVLSNVSMEGGGLPSLGDH